jgi:Na+/H+-dicarboxylate symporter
VIDTKEKLKLFKRDISITIFISLFIGISVGLCISNFMNNIIYEICTSIILVEISILLMIWMIVIGGINRHGMRVRDNKKKYKLCPRYKCYMFCDNEKCSSYNIINKKKKNEWTPIVIGIATGLTSGLVVAVYSSTNNIIIILGSYISVILITIAFINWLIREYS